MGSDERAFMVKRSPCPCNVCGRNYTKKRDLSKIDVPTYATVTSTTKIPEWTHMVVICKECHAHYGTPQRVIIGDGHYLLEFEETGRLLPFPGTSVPQPEYSFTAAS